MWRVLPSTVRETAPAMQTKSPLDLKLILTVVAIVEVFYAIAGLMPPRLVFPMTGWVLGPDGHWIMKLLAVALATQALTAWAMRNSPHLGVAKALAFYQFASATVDWVMWMALANEGIFSNAQARGGVLAAIPSHYALGVWLLLGIRRTSTAPVKP
jgi:hypothetical protein